MTMAIESRNPSTGEELARYEALDGAGVEERLRRAVTAFRVWKNTPFELAGKKTHGSWPVSGDCTGR